MSMTATALIQISEQATSPRPPAPDPWTYSLPSQPASIELWLLSARSLKLALASEATAAAAACGRLP